MTYSGPSPWDHLSCSSCPVLFSGERVVYCAHDSTPDTCASSHPVAVSVEVLCISVSPARPQIMRTPNAPVSGLVWRNGVPTLVLYGHTGAHYLSADRFTGSIVVFHRTTAGRPRAELPSVPRHPSWRCATRPNGLGPCHNPGAQDKVLFARVIWAIAISRPSCIRNPAQLWR